MNPLNHEAGSESHEPVIGPSHASLPPSIGSSSFRFLLLNYWTKTSRNELVYKLMDSPDRALNTYFPSALISRCPESPRPFGSHGPSINQVPPIIKRIIVDQNGFPMQFIRVVHDLFYAKRAINLALGLRRVVMGDEITSDQHTLVLQQDCNT